MAIAIKQQAEREAKAKASSQPAKPVANSSTTSRQAILQKMQQIRFKEFGPLDGVTLNDAVTRYLEPECRKLDPKGGGLGFAWGGRGRTNSDVAVESALIGIHQPLHDVSLLQAINALCLTSFPRLRADVRNGRVSFSRQTDNAKAELVLTAEDRRIIEAPMGERPAATPVLQESLIKLEDVEIPNFGPLKTQPLSEVVRRLEKDIRSQNTTKNGANILIEGSINDLFPNRRKVHIRIPDAMGTVSLKAALDAICRGSEPPIKAVLEDYAVTFVRIPPRQIIQRKLEEIRFKQFGPFDGLPLSEVVKILYEECRNLDPDKKGVNFFLNPYLNQPDRMQGSQPQPAPPRVDMQNVLIRTAGLEDVTLAQALDAICKLADQPIQFIVEDYVIIFTAKPDTRMFTRTFKVDPSVFMQGLQGVIQRGGLPGVAVTSEGQQVNQANAGQVAEQFFEGMTRVPNGDQSRAIRMNASARFDPQTGVITATASQPDLDAIGSAIDYVIQVANFKPAQFTIEVKVVEVPESVAREVGLQWFTESFKGVTNDYSPVPPGFATNKNVELTLMAVPNVTGLLSEPQMKALLRKLETMDGVDMLFLPRVTTLTTRQAHLEMFDYMDVLTGERFKWEERPRSNTNLIQVGLAVDVLLHAFEDGDSIKLTHIFSLTEDLGAASQPAGTRADAHGKCQIRFRQVIERSLVRDGYTLVIGCGATAKDGKIVSTKVPVLGDIPLVGKLFRSKKQLPEEIRHVMILLTPTLIDPAGNRIQPAD